MTPQKNVDTSVVLKKLFLTLAFGLGGLFVGYLLFTSILVSITTSNINNFFIIVFQMYSLYLIIVSYIKAMSA